MFLTSLGPEFLVSPCSRWPLKSRELQATLLFVGWSWAAHTANWPQASYIHSFFPPPTQNPWQSRRTLEQLRNPKDPDLGKSRWRARTTHLQWSPECSTTKIPRGRVEHYFLLNYRWDALTTKETQEEPVSGRNNKHLHNMHGAFSASRRCCTNRPTGWGPLLSMGLQN